MVAARDVPRHLQAFGSERRLRALEEPRVARERRVRAAARRRHVRVPEAVVAIGGDAGVVVVVGHAGVAPRGDVGVQSIDRRLVGAAARVGGADRLAGERVDPPAVEHALEPARLVELLVVGEIAGGDGEAELRASAAPADLAAPVRVDVADDLVEDLQADRLHRPPRGADLVAGRRPGSRPAPATSRRRSAGRSAERRTRASGGRCGGRSTGARRGDGEPGDPHRRRAGAARSRSQPRGGSSPRSWTYRPGRRRRPAR